MSHDLHYMRHALMLASRGLGTTWPNPSVGALLVKNGQIIATATTAQGGRPHAEPQAIAQAGERAKGATLYVSLEPCSHQGQTGPCTKAIIDAGITRVVIACGDSNPHVAGQGIAQLKKAGIEVLTGLLEHEARALNAGFFSVLERKRPFVTLKLATSLDGKIASESGQSQWITGETARMRGHLLRAQHDAILTGMGTILSDNPMLDCRIAGLEERSPVRVTIDRQARLPLDCKLVESAKTHPLWVAGHAPHPQEKALTAKKVECLTIADDGEIGFLPALFQTLAQKGITRLLVEAGSGLNTACLQLGLVDQIYWFRAPIMLGQGGLAAIGGGFAGELHDLPRWKHEASIPLTPDSLDIYTHV